MMWCLIFHWLKQELSVRARGDEKPGLVCGCTTTVMLQLSDEKEMSHLQETEVDIAL